jgi:hypothetical protein
MMYLISKCFIIKSCVKTHTNFKLDRKRFSVKNQLVDSPSLTKSTHILQDTGKSIFLIKLVFLHKKDHKKLHLIIIIVMVKQTMMEMVRMIVEFGLF